MSQFQTAKVRWYDNLSGEGFVRLENGESVFFHFSSLVDQLTPKELPEGRLHAFPSDYERGFTLEGGTPVMVEVYRDTHWKQVSKLKVEV
jgi:cold shock CspA family protein